MYLTIEFVNIFSKLLQFNIIWVMIIDHKNIFKGRKIYISYNKSYESQYINKILIHFILDSKWNEWVFFLFFSSKNTF